MEGGRDWWQQITEAIDHVEFPVLVMTSAALGSEYVRREWRYARQQGKCVIPVIGGPDIDFDSLPGWMRREHFVPPDVPDQWRRFVRTLDRCDRRQTKRLSPFCRPLFRLQFSIAAAELLRDRLRLWCPSPAMGDARPVSKRFGLSAK
jgi:TIR domain